LGLWRWFWLEVGFAGLQSPDWRRWTAKCKHLSLSDVVTKEIPNRIDRICIAAFRKYAGSAPAWLGRHHTGEAVS
jgi:hypothetical protein